MNKATAKKVLIVEDDSAIIDIYQAMAKKAKFGVEFATTGQETLKKIKDAGGGFALVLLDLILPDMNGMEVLRQLRADSATKNMKIFILSNQQEETVAPVEGAKADKFIIKAEIAPTELFELIGKNLG